MLHRSVDEATFTSAGNGKMRQLRPLAMGRRKAPGATPVLRKPRGTTPEQLAFRRQLMSILAAAGTAVSTPDLVQRTGETIHRVHAACRALQRNGWLTNVLRAYRGRPVERWVTRRPRPVAFWTLTEAGQREMSRAESSPEPAEQ